MRKAASQRTRVLFSALVLLFVFLFSYTVAAAYSVDPSQPIAVDQDETDAITGSIRLEGTSAVGTIVNQGTERIVVGMASYLKVDDVIDNQSLSDSVSSEIGPGETKELRVNVPCWAQVDIYKGDVLSSFKNNVRYAKRLIGAIHTTEECNGGSEPTPSASASATPAPTSVPTEAPKATDSPRTDLTDGRSDGRGCSVNDCSGNVVGTGGVVAGVSTDRQLPSTGTKELFDAAMISLGLLSLGFSLRKLAYNLEK